MPETVGRLYRVLADEVCRRMTAVAGGNRAVRRLEPAVELLTHHMTVGAGFRVIREVGPTLGIGESINANPNGNADNYPKQDTLYCAGFHLCFPFLTSKRSIKRRKGSPGHGLIFGELVCSLCKTSISGAPREPDGGFTPTIAAKVGATSMVQISR